MKEFGSAVLAILTRPCFSENLSSTVAIGFSVLASRAILC